MGAWLASPFRGQLLGQDPLIQDGEDRARLSALLLQRYLARLLVDVESFGMHAQRVVGTHELGARPLSPGRRADRRAQLTEYLFVLAGRQPGVKQGVDGNLPLILQPTHWCGDDLAIGQVRKRRITP